MTFHNHRLTIPLLLCLTCLTVTGCTGAKNKNSQSNWTVVDDSAAMTACMQRCSQNDELGQRTKKGCIKGCEMAQQNAPFFEERYWNEQECTSKLAALDRQVIAQRMWKMCQSKWNHLYRRIGCRDAMRKYYAAISTNMCVVQNPQKTPSPASEKDTPQTEEMKNDTKEKQ